MIINASNLKTLYVAFNAAFKQGQRQAESQFGRVATTVPSSTGSNEYGWLGQVPSMRKWAGDRVVNSIAAHGYTIKNDPYEETIAVPRPAIEDDQYGVYTPLMQEMGRATAAHPDELVFGLLKDGASTLCYDGQYFFDADHPVIKADGSTESQSNWDNNSGSGTAWYLLDASRAIKPLIYQTRKAAQFTALDSNTDENVFMRNEYLYGVDSRCNVGFGFWQMAYGSRKALDETNLVAAYKAMTERKGDHGRPLGIKPTVLVVPPGLKFDALKLVSATTGAAGATNVMNGLVDVVDVPWLA